ncbi:MAG TPA: prepilin-type N-terminal cleavage/methylation domain-containing protein [Candidatus Limnocylindrales bacterium]|nr:prepilin-type N-terminal cleavage/methylation domain-containing protein [Candidatus Limnocylindrales bacterium]
MRSTTHHRQRGFTLFEVVVVVVIIGVIAALVVPSMNSGWRQGAVRRSVRTFISASRAASAKAVSTRKAVGLSVYEQDGRFGIEGGEQTFELPGFAEFGAIEGGREGEAEDEIVFDFFPTGASVGGSVEIEFEVAGGRQAYVLIFDPLIGRLRIEEAS